MDQKRPKGVSHKDSITAGKRNTQMDKYKTTGKNKCLFHIEPLRVETTRTIRGAGELDLRSVHRRERVLLAQN